MKGFNYITSLDQIMGYYAMEIEEEDRDYLGIITPKQIYTYNRLPQGVKIATDLYQREMVYVFDGLEYVKVFLDDETVIGRHDFDTHIKELDEVVTRMEDAELQLNIKKTKWCADKAAVLGFIITKDGYGPDPRKIQGLINMKAPKNKKQVRQYIGGLNFYRKLWERRSHVIAPLTDLLGDKPFKWTEIENAAFENSKSILAKETMLCYPDFTKPFHLFPDA